MRILPAITAIAVLAVSTSPAVCQRLEFVNARYASYSSLTLYAGYSAGPGLVFVGLLHTPRAAFRQALIGFAKPFKADHLTLLLGVAAATSGERAFAQLYVLPTLSAGPVTLDATAALQKPLAGGPAALSVSPANALVRVAEAWRVGATWALSATFGRGHNQALGPALVRGVPGGSLGVHVLRGFGDRPSEIWLTARVTP